MANTWLRLWHDMPNDPKWRTISRISGQPVSLVQATYIHILVSASQNVTRGHTDVTNEDLASALDVTEEEISSVVNAMQGRVLDGSSVSGWERRQVKKEEGGNPESLAMTAAERKRKQRERDKNRALEDAQKGGVTGGHDESQKVTPDKDKDKDLKTKREHNAHDEFVDNSDSVNSEKFRMFEEWAPSPDFSARALEWGINLHMTNPFTGAQLCQFRSYWMPEDAMKHHLQWEMTFARSLEHQAIKKLNET